MARLEEQLEKERQQRGEEKPPEIRSELTPEQQLRNTNIELEKIRKQQELDSVTLGYANFKEREKTIADREAELIKGINQIKEDRDNLTKEREDLLGKYNSHKEEYDTLMSAIKTREKEAERIMTEAIAKKSEADNIINSQTESEKFNQAKQEAYDANMDESITLMNEIVNTLRHQEDGKALALSVALNKDLKLIQWLQYKKCNLQTLADIIDIECDRIIEVCEYLQDSKRDHSKLLNYLLQSTEWLQTKLKIEWKPDEEMLPG